MTALLTDNLPLLAGAPNGIKKLRELILELAVHGKLVPQDPNEGQASDWLRRIEIEKARLHEAGLWKKPKEVTDVELDFGVSKVPSSWDWVTLSDITLGMDSGWSPACEPNPSSSNDVWGVLKTTAVQVMRFLQKENKELPAHLDPRPDAEVKPGDILFTRAGPTNRVGISCLVESTRPRLMISDKIIRFHPIEAGTYGRYVALCLNAGSTARYLEIAKSGMAASQVNISQGKLKLAPVPLAPLPEQHRIVAKVDELMVLCDHLEAQQADAESAHAQLVQALLDSLTQASDATDFAANWQRLAEHFHTLFTTEHSIDALKQTLLQLAVVGKLVPQDPSDEPASELLKNVQLEKHSTIVGKNKHEKLRNSDTDNEVPFKLPSQWAWAHLGEVAISGPSNGNSPKPASGETPYRCLTLSATTRGTFNDQCFKFVDINADTASKYFLKDGDLLIQRANSIDYVGVSAIYDGLDDQFIFPDLMMRLRISDYLSRSFIHAYLSSMTGRAYFRNHATGTQGNMPKINQSTVVNAPIPIPPLREQHRIVEKVDQLMALCDQLKTRLSQARQLNEQQASTLVARALVEDKNQEKPDATLEAARSLLAAEITHQLHSHRTFGQRKLQKVIYLAEHAGKLTAIQGQYLRDAAGPHDRQLMSQVESSLQEQQWYERIHRDTVGHAYKPLSAAGQHRERYKSCWAPNEREKIQKVITLMKDWTTDRCEMTVTLYAAWNDLILDGLPVTDDAILAEVLHSWSHTKLRFKKSEWLAVLTNMKKIDGLTPSGFGSRTIGGALSFPGFEQSPRSSELS